MIKKLISIGVICIFLQSCQSIQPASPLCNSIVAPKIQKLLFQAVTYEQMIELIETTYKVRRDSIATKQYGTFQSWSVQWQDASVWYDVYVESNTLKDLRITYEHNLPTIGNIMACLEVQPDAYWSEYKSPPLLDTPHVYEAGFDLYFASKGIMIVSYQREHEPFIPPRLNEKLPVAWLAFVEPGTIQEVHNRVGGFDDDFELSIQPEPWPGSWDKVRYLKLEKEYLPK